MNHYDAADFTRRMDAALARIRTLLDNTKHPQYPADVPHRYDDKFLLAEFLGRGAVAALLQCLDNLGLGPAHFARLREWAATRSVTLRLDATEECTFEREVTREVDATSKRVIEVSGRQEKTTITDKVVTTVKEYHWSFRFRWELLAFQGTATEDALRLLSRGGRIGLVTTTREPPPRPKLVVRPAIDANITWLLQQVDAAARASFAIDRAHERCHTPRRNPDVERALAAALELAGWCARVESYFLTQLFPVQQSHGLDLAAIDTGELFSPVLPLFAGGGEEAGVVPFAWLEAFLEEQRRALVAKCDALARAFPADESVITVREACLVLTVRHAREVCAHLGDGVNHIEAMLRQQLVAAIGKEVGPSEFADYMTWHHRKLFRPAYRPRPFSYAIRRPDHDPEGTLGLEARGGRPMPAPIATIVKSGAAPRPMRFPLDAATQVSFGGERHLHAWVAHRFSGETGQSLALVARARQFSSFILLVGRIASADTFEPRQAVIVQNKDVVEIPLLLEQIPTPKEFRDAIESLSPEQQRFARAFRGMQLESTLFGICVLQIKPQLEKLLRLPPDSLTKEIQLGQDLLQLFMEYQIPSDLLSYDGPADAPTAEKLARVGQLVTRMQALIAGARQKELEEAQEREAFRRAELNMTPIAGDPFLEVDYASADGFGAGDPFGPPPGFGGGRAPAMPAPPPVPARSAPVPMSPAPMPAPPPPVVQTSAQPPQPTQQQPQQPQQPQPVQPGQPTGGEEAGAGVDYTRIPAQLDRRLEQLDGDSALRPTIINPGDPWTRTARKSLLAEPEEQTLYADEQRREKNRAFDLIDALSKSGSIPFEDASLHVVIAATHCFDETLLNTVIQRNVNPIEKVEVSSVIVATTIHDAPAVELLMEDQRARVFGNAPRLEKADPA